MDGEKTRIKAGGSGTVQPGKKPKTGGEGAMENAE